MNKLKIEGVVTQGVLNKASVLLSQKELTNLEVNINFLIQEMEALRGSNLSYGESLIAREMLRKGYLLSYIEVDNE